MCKNLVAFFVFLATMTFAVKLAFCRNRFSKSALRKCHKSRRFGGKMRKTFFVFAIFFSFLEFLCAESSDMSDAGVRFISKIAFRNLQERVSLLKLFPAICRSAFYF